MRMAEAAGSRRRAAEQAEQAADRPRGTGSRRAAPRPPYGSTGLRKNSALARAVQSYKVQQFRCKSVLGRTKGFSLVRSPW